MPTLSGFAFDSAGVAINGATINVYARNTTTPVVSTTTTNASGYWTRAGVAEGRYDIEVVNGTTTRRMMYDDEIQIERGEFKNLQIRGSDNAFALTFVLGAITAARNLTIPTLTGNDTMAVLGMAQTFTANKTFNSTNLLVRNPADTFSYTLAGGAITADRTLNLPVITGTDTLGALGVAATWTAVQTFVAPVLGTPGSGTLTNCTGLPISTGVSGLGAGVATALATLSSANLAAAVTDETGSGALLFATSPTMAGTWAGAITFSGSTLTFSASTASTSTATGALVVTGGVGVGGQATIGNLSVTGSATNILTDVTGTISPAAGISGSVMRISPTIVEAASGNHPILVGLRLDAPTVTAGAATVTDTATLYIGNAMSATVAGLNYALLVDAGVARFNGNVKIAGSATRATTEATNSIYIFDGTAPVGTLANGISLYSTAGELRVMDSAGNATLLSPHARDGSWIYDSVSPVTGKHLRVDMERMVKFLNEKFGQDWVKEIAA